MKLASPHQPQLALLTALALALPGCAAEVVPDDTGTSDDTSSEASTSAGDGDESGDTSTDGTGDGSSETGSSSGNDDSTESSGGSSSGGDGDDATTDGGDGDSGSSDGDGDTTDSGDGDSAGDGDGDPPDGICDGVCSSVDCGPCPALSTVAVLDFTISAYEITNAQYEDFVALTHNMDIQPSECDWNASYEPSDGWPAAFAEQEHPVAYVDWCDAKAYCEWAGMRLCGGRVADTVPYNEWDNPVQSEWMAACSDDGTFTYPYGDSYEANFCNGVDAGLGDVVEVGLLSDCEGSVDGLFDMSGNVWEWDNSCEDFSGATDDCRRRGGSRFSDANILRCAVGSGRPRNHTDSSTGIRCCAD